MGLFGDLLRSLGSASSSSPDKKQTARGIQADDISNAIGAMRGNKQDKIDLANRAKDLIPGQIDDIVIDGMVGGSKPKSSKKTSK